MKKRAFLIMSVLLALSYALAVPIHALERAVNYTRISESEVYHSIHDIDFSKYKKNAVVKSDIATGEITVIEFDEADSLNEFHGMLVSHPVIPDGIEADIPRASGDDVG